MTRLGGRAAGASCGFRLSSVVSAALVAAAAGKSGAGLPYLECEGPNFDPIWGEFKRKFGGQPLVRGKPVGEELASLASDLLDAVESANWAISVAAFNARLRGDEEAEEALQGFCVYGAVTAYATIAIHLDHGAGEWNPPPTAKSSLARALLLLAKKQSNDFLESTAWPIRSMDLVGMLEGEDVAQVRELEQNFRLPCHLRLACPATRLRAEEEVSPPEPPLALGWPAEVAAVGIHITSTLEAVTALRDAIGEAWGRGGAGGAPFRVRYAGHPCPTHEGSEHQCQMRCDLLGQCGDVDDPLADFIAGAVDVAQFEERESYSLSEARAALRWVPRRLESLARADLFLCTFPTVLCVLLHEMFPEKPLLLVAIANPLFAAPGCTRHEDNTVRECDSQEATDYLVALREMLSKPLVRGVAAYTVTAALVGYQAGIQLPLAGKAGRYLPPGAAWSMQRESEVLVARTRFLETAWGANLRHLIDQYTESLEVPVRCLLQQELGTYMSYEDLSAFRAVVIFPQDLGLHKFTEHYAMGMPIWMPSREWAYRLQMFIPWGMVSYSGSWHGGPEPRSDAGDEGRLSPPSEDWPQAGSPELAHPPFFNAQTAPYPLAKAAFWYEFSEFVSYPGVQTFDSVPGMLIGLASTNLFAVAGEMRRFRAELWKTTRAVYAAEVSKLAAKLKDLELERAS